MVVSFPVSDWSAFAPPNYRFVMFVVVAPAVRAFTILSNNVTLSLHVITQYCELANCRFVMFSLEFFSRFIPAELFCRKADFYFLPTWIN